MSSSHVFLKHLPSHLPLHIFLNLFERIIFDFISFFILSKIDQKILKNYRKFIENLSKKSSKIFKKNDFKMIKNLLKINFFKFDLFHFFFVNF